MTEDIDRMVQMFHIRLDELRRACKNNRTDRQIVAAEKEREANVLKKTPAECAVVYERWSERKEGMLGN